MVKLVTVLETQACRSCRNSGFTLNGQRCSACGGCGQVQVEIIR